MNAVGDGAALACWRIDPAAARERFDLSGLAELEMRMVTLGRLAVTDDRAIVRDILWDSLACYLLDRGLDYLFAPVPVPVCHDDAAALWRHLDHVPHSPENLRVAPWTPVPYGVASAPCEADAKAFLRWKARGAWLCGEAAYDASAGLAYVPFLVPLVRMRVPRLRAFLARAA